MKGEYTTGYRVFNFLLRLFFVFSVVFIIFGIFYQIFYIDNKSRILNEFSNSLYHCPLPPDTVAIETRKFDGDNFLGGNGGYWNVGASMTLSTKLTREDIVNFYKDTKFPFPKSDKLGEVPEIYFEDDIQKKEYRDMSGNRGFYYVNKMGRSNDIHTFFDKNGEMKNIEKMKENNGQDLIYTIQILSGYDYFFNIN